ncbi:MAG: 16S rRNA (cytosine(967)-C(5))-methyltransferase RsmB [Candidatus Coatesbacteria bacterium]|nr:16S rRNA (cytosine(967)-C(5))-methyltransferase RsmB [Candidatus Coatesbacteria bacterium]
MTDARSLAWEVLLEVADGERAEEALRRRLSDSGLAAVDRHLAYELVLGSIRWRGLLDYSLDALTASPLHAMQPALRELLRLGAYQLVKLDRVPAYAAVNSAVEAARSKRSTRRAAGLVNAVLRRLDRERPLPPSYDNDPARHLSVVHSHPRWLVERWLERYGPERTRALLENDNAPRPTWVFGNPPAGAVDAGDFEPLEGFPDAWRYRGEADLTTRPEYTAGLIFAADPATTAAPVLLNPRSGEKVLDAAAAPGGKTAHLRRLGSDDLRLVALELSRPRRAALAAAVKRLGLRAAVVGGDLTAPPFVPRSFDALLLDAPCSNTGVLARRVEVRWRLKPTDLERLANLQVSLLRSAAGLVRRGGRLVYSTCSLEPEENLGVVRRFLKKRKDYHLDGLTAADPGRAGLPPEHFTLKDGCLSSLPGESGLDGAFVAVLAAD